MSSGSSRSSRSSNSRASNSPSGYVTRYTIPPRVPSPPLPRYQHRHDARALRDVREEIETYDLQIANAAAIKERGRELVREAEARERALNQERNRALQRMNGNAVAVRQDLPAPVIVERTPSEYGVNSTTSKSGSSQNGRGNRTSRPKRVHFEVVGMSRPARPKTIWGTPAWS